MKPERAVEILTTNKERKTATTYLRCKYTAIEALVKQIPQKPLWIDSVPHSKCPICNNVVATYIDSPKLPYCAWCGQKLDWGEKE